MREEYAESSPHFQSESERLRGRIREIESQIRTLRRAESGTDGTETFVNTPAAREPQILLNPVHTSLVARRLELDRELEALSAAMDARKLVVTETREKLDALVALGPIYARLEREVAEKEARVRGLEQAHLRLSTLQLIDSDERMDNILVTQDPFLPRGKEGPQRSKILLAGLAGGLALGVSVALGRQFLDPKLRYPGRVESALGLRVLGVVPEHKQWRHKGSSLKKNMRDQS